MTEQKRECALIADAIRAARTVAVCTHVNPDGDTLGSGLCMKLAMERMGKSVDVYNRDKVPDNLAFLPGADSVLHDAEPNGRSYDLLLCTDISDKARMGCEWLTGYCGRMIQIDHHSTNPMYAEVNSVDGNAAATCVMIAEQLEALGIVPDRDMAVCLYTGISTDTGNFAFPCTNSEAFAVMTRLMELDLPLPELNRILFRERSREQLLLIGRAIASLRFECSGRIGVMTLTRADFDACGALNEHADTVVNFALDTVGTDMALLAREDGNGIIKCSLRAVKPYTVSEVATAFGGGGHEQAAGITTAGELEDVAGRVAQAMADRLNGKKQ